MSEVVVLTLLILFLRARVPVVVLSGTLLALEQIPLQAAVVIDSWTAKWNGLDFKDGATQDN